MTHLEEILKSAEERRQSAGQRTTTAGVSTNFIYVMYFLAISGLAIWLVIAAKSLDWILKAIS